MTKRQVIVRRLERAGFVNAGGGSHDKFVHPDGRRALVPRHREIKNALAAIILRQAGVVDERSSKHAV